MSQMPLFSASTFEYLFLISPPEIIEQQVQWMKDKLDATITLSARNKRSKAHISLATIISAENIDEIVKNKTRRAVLEMQAPEITLDGIGVFEHGKVSKTMFLKIDDESPIKEINDILSSVFNKLKLEKPHLTIARSIPVEDFNKISPNLEDYNYKGTFLCESITILRKEIQKDNPESNYTKIAECFFQKPNLN